MANPFYTYSGAFIPGTLARAEQVGAEYSSVQAGFAILAIQGTDSGTANTYVVTTNGGPSGSYADGNIVEFKAAASNTGASTINVNGIGVVGLAASGGGSLASGAIVAHTWYRAMYNSTYSAWTLIAPSSVVISTSTVSAAAPTNKVGLSAAGGVSLNVVPIDATYAIDQSIAPTWTGAHTFASTVTFNSALSISAGLAVVGIVNAYTTVTADPTTGQSFGLLVKAGTNASDVALQVNSRSGTSFLAIQGAGSVVVGTPTGGGKGVGTINAQNLYVQGAAVLTTSVSSANPSVSVGLAAVNGGAATFMTSDSAPSLSQAIAPTWTAAHVFTPSSAVVAATINAAANTVGFQVTGGTNTSLSYLVQFATAQGSGFSSGLLLKAGTTAADNSLLVQNAAATATYLQLKGDGSGSLGFNGTAATIQFAAAGNIVVPASASTTLPSVQISTNATALVAFYCATAGAVGLQMTSAGSDFCKIQNDSANLWSIATTSTLAGRGTPVFQWANNGSPQLQGRGPVAAALVDMTPDKGTFTATLTGCTTSPTTTATWSRIGNLVTIYMPGLSGTSNTTACTLTGLPAALQPASLTQTITTIGNTNVFENNTASATGAVLITAGSGTITLQLSTGITWSSTAWTASGTKGISTGSALTFSYLLN